MIGQDAALGIALVALGLVLTPGPNMLYLVARALSQGRAAGFAALAGTVLGFLVYLAATVAGISAVFAAVPSLHTVLRLAGAAYLLWLGVGLLRVRGPEVLVVGRLPAASTARLVVGGVTTNLLNPKAAVLHLSLLWLFIDPARGAVAAQSLILGMIQISVSVVVNAAIVLAVGALAEVVASRPRWAVVQRTVMGAALAAFGLKLLTDRPVP